MTRIRQIALNNLLPQVFWGDETPVSEVWNSDIKFDKGNAYLIEAVSGKGKSSLCSYIYGYRTDYRGNIFFNGENIRLFRPAQWDNIRQAGLSLLFQELNLFPELTAWENVLLKNNLTRYKTPAEIDDMFARLGIADRKHRKIEKMSWGQQQRVAVIRCLCQPFDFILLDEPVSHLDDDNAANVAALVQEEAARQQAGVIVTSIGKHLPMEYSKRILL
ncbi:MAG: ATP-binding cassette domain-containing protein [Prevotella sp.]|jgi:ABC-type lipoprotein export system ATPase subunit|nr:ATP-binding cassette domain-containing protein [Prevotella sp.]